MMTKTKTPRKLGIKFLWALPAVALLLFAFAEPEYQVSYSQTDNGNVLDSNVFISQNTIKMEGIVRDDSGKPLPGTSIVIKGTTVGTVADSNGKFELEIPEQSSIVLSYVGKKTIEDNYEGITSGTKKGNTFAREYMLEDVVIEIHNKVYIGEKPPPPPPPKPAIEKEVKDVPPPPPPLQTGEEKIFYIVEDMPKFPGGFAGLEKYYTEMQQKIAQSEGTKGKAKVAFTIDVNGKVTNIKVVEKDNDGAAKGAIRIASEMPDWTPGKQRGKPVPVKFLLPLEFN